MTTYRKGEVVVRRIEFAVKAGSDIGTVNKVEHIAFQDWNARTGSNLGSISSAPDDWCQVNITDDEIVFAFTVEHEPTSAEHALARVRQVYTELQIREAQHNGSGREGRLNEADLFLIGEALDGTGTA
jgi:hypothetical protein